MKPQSDRTVKRTPDRARRIDYRAPVRKAVTTVALDCGHTNAFDKPAPVAGQMVYCRTCETYRRVTKETTNA